MSCMSCGIRARLCFSSGITFFSYVCLYGCGFVCGVVLACFGLLWLALAYNLPRPCHFEYLDSFTTHPRHRNKHMQVDFGTGNNNKINFRISDKQELIDIIEVVYRGAKKGRGLVVSPKDYSTKSVF